MKDLITYQPVSVSRGTPKNDTSFLIFTFDANYDTINAPYFLFCDDLESRFDFKNDVTKNSATMLQDFDYCDK